MTTPVDDRTDYCVPDENLILPVIQKILFYIFLNSCVRQAPQPK